MPSALADGSSRARCPPLHLSAAVHYALHALLAAALLFVVAQNAGPRASPADALLGRQAFFRRGGGGDAEGSGQEVGNDVDAPRRVVLFHHITAINQWQDVVRDQLAKVVYRRGILSYYSRDLRVAASVCFVRILAERTAAA